MVMKLMRETLRLQRITPPLQIQHPHSLKHQKPMVYSVEKRQPRQGKKINIIFHAQ